MQHGAMRSPESELESLRDAALHRVLRHRDGAQGREVSIDGRRLVNFSSNDYLGLCDSAAVCEAGAKAAAEGGSGASRLIAGGSSQHRRLEAELADFLERDSALVFANGYSCALGAIGAVVGKGDTVILDKRCHASLIDGARLSGATLRVFPHHNLDKLGRLLDGGRSDEGSRVLIVTESVFSMDGDAAPLEDIVALKRRHGALLLLDEAHALGVIGPSGRGLAAALACAGEVDLFLGTLGKAAGAAGGFVSSSAAWIDLIANRARSFIFSTAPPVSQIAAARAGLRELRSAEGDSRRRRLHRAVGQLCGALGCAVPAGAIVPLVLGDERLALRVSADLEAAGLLVPAIRYPTVARGAARLRVSLSAAHLEEDVSTLALALRGLLGEREATGPDPAQPAHGAPGPLPQVGSQETDS